ncbi:MAG: sugar phosphate isomerase/epimerase [Phycisphaeraceae bacterium]|nr:MAG: sugar phosphate isomerase/epimerase [Phycisphaeraceae bacterium]
MSICIAIQLYSLREECQRDLEATLSDLRDIGYRRVEFDREYVDPEEAGRMLGSLEMSACGLHVVLERIEDHPQSVVDACLALRTRRAIVSFVPRPLTPELAEGLRGRLDAAAALLAAHGVSLGYHSHDWEFTPWSDGERPFNVVSRARRIFLEPDLGWVWHGGLDPVAFLREHAGRCTIAHIKDSATQGDRDSTCAVGEGAFPSVDVVRLAPALGVETLVVEFNTPGKHSVYQAAQRSLDFIMAQATGAGGA